MALVATVPAPEEEPTSSGPAYEFDEELQARLLNLMMRDHQFATRTAGLVLPEYFTDESNQALCRMATAHFAAYREPLGFGKTFLFVIKKALAEKRIDPAIALVIREKLIRDAYKIPPVDREFLIERAVEFAKQRAIENAILKAAEIVGKPGYVEKVEKLWREALLVGESRVANVYDYWEAIETRTQYRKDILAGVIKRSGITTGVLELDQLLYHHGWGRKELTVIMGAAKGGKSMALCDFAKYASLAKKNVIYFTLEVGADIIADRIDANISDMEMGVIGSSPSAVKAAIELASRGAGHLKVEEYASGTLKVSQIRRALDRWRSQGIVFDLIVVDYGDLMAPESRNEDLRESMRQIFVDLRGIAFEENAAVLTATQTNREGAKHTLAKATDVAEDFNKIRTADLVLSINSSDDERLRNEARIYFAASRNGLDGIVLTIQSIRAKMQFIKSVIGKPKGAGAT